jgi:hypothetical protein
MRTRAWLPATLLLLAPGGAHAQAGPADAFALQSLPVAGRVVAAEIADTDGDGRAELLLVVARGTVPDETREIRVHAPGADGRLAETPAWSAPLPPAAVMYDVADLDGRPGAELLLLERDGVRVLSRAGGDASWRKLLVAAGPTAGVRPDERGLDRVRLVRPELGAGRLLVPGLDEAWVLGANGESIARLAIGGRANYLITPRPGPAISENELEIYFDVPTLHVADLDGDARGDVVASSRHGLRIFRQRDGGGFPDEPDGELLFRLIPLEDQVRNTGSVRAEVADLDGDGRADLLVSHASGGLVRAVNRTRIHRNRGGSFDLAKPDQVVEKSGGVAGDELVDVDGDGRVEWLRVFVPLGLLELAELFVQRQVDLEAALHRPDAERPFAEPAALVRRFSVPMDFETLRPRGFVPTLREDWNRDGYRDLVTAGNGQTIEIWLGGPGRDFARIDASQALDTGGRLRPGDLDGDGLPDFVLYDPRRADAPVRVGANRGVLPGTRASIHPR